MIRLLLKKQSDLGLPFLFRPFGRASSVHNFRAFTIQVDKNTFSYFFYDLTPKMLGIYKPV